MNMMKKVILLAAALLPLLPSLEAMAGNAPAVRDSAEVTVMYYAVGEKLDDGIDTAIVHGFENLKKEGLLGNKVNVTAMVKYSHDDDNFHGFLGKPESVYRFVFDENSDEISYGGHLPDSYRIATDSLFDTSDPCILADFIRWSAQNAPARKYALILSGHGEGYHPWGDDFSAHGSRHEVEYSPKNHLAAVHQRERTKRKGSSSAAYSPSQAEGILIDIQVLDTLGTTKNGNAILYERCITPSKLAKALKMGGIPIEVIDFDMCLANMLEIQGELQGTAKYSVASNYAIDVVKGIIHMTGSLLSRYDTEEALRLLALYKLDCQPDMDSERLTVPTVGGFCVNRLDSMGNVLASVKRMTGLLLSKQRELSSFERQGQMAKADSLRSRMENVINECYRYEDLLVDVQYPHFDIGDLFAKFAREFYDEDAIVAALREFEKARDGAIASHPSNLYLWDGSVSSPSWSVNLVSKGVWPFKDKDETGAFDMYDIHPNGDICEYGNDNVIGRWNSTIQGTYFKTRFHKETGWGTFLLENEITPTDNPTMSKFNVSEKKKAFEEFLKAQEKEKAHAL